MPFFALILLLGSHVAADYLLTQGFSSDTCQGAPVATIVSSFAEACSLLRTKAVCINSTAATIFEYTDSSCTTPTGPGQVETAPYPVCTPGTGIITGKAVLTTCATGAFTKPTTGFVRADLYDAISCSQVPVTVSAYKTDACLQQGLGGVRFTCEQGVIRSQEFSDASCAGSVTAEYQYKYGCDLGNRSVNDCYVPASDSSSSRVSPAAVGGAVGGSLSVLALGAAAAYFWRLRSASSKERAPLL